MFLVKEGNTPVMNQCEFPLIVVRYPYNRQIHPTEHYDNQVATYMLIDVLSGNMGCQVVKGGILDYLHFWPKINIIKELFYFINRRSTGCQKGPTYDF